MRFVPQQFFPSSDRPELLVDLQLPENASIYATRDVSARVDALLKDDPDVDHWSTYVGQGAVRFYLPLNVQLPNDFFAQARGRHQGAGAARAREGEAGAGAGERVPERRRARLSAGARPAGRLAAAVPRERAGPGPGARDRLQGRRRSSGPSRGARNVNYNWMEPARTVRIRVDQDQARLLGLSSQDLAQSLNTVVSGVTATQLRSGIYLVDVVVRASAEQRMSLVDDPHAAGAAAERARPFR